MNLNEEKNAENFLLGVLVIYSVGDEFQFEINVQRVKLVHFRFAFFLVCVSRLPSTNSNSFQHPKDL